MRILVTGATGFIGAHLCRALSAAGHSVRALRRANTPLLPLEGLGIEAVTGDLTQPDSLLAATEGMEAIFHLAAWTASQGQAGRQYTVTVEGTRAILSAARHNQVQRVIHVSAAAALGVPRGMLPVDECHTWNYAPQGYPFGYAKYLAEMEVQKAVALGMDIVIVNPTQVVGAGDRYRRSNSIIIKTAQRKLSMSSAGGANLIHVADVVSGLLAVLERGRRGERYLLGGENLTHSEILGLIAEAANYAQPNVILPGGLLRALARPAQWLHPFLNLPVEPELLGLAGYYFYYLIEKARVELGWQPQFSARQGVQEAYRWFLPADLTHHTV